jgi:hypothetical protein
MTRQRDDGRHLLGRELGWRATSVVIGQHLTDLLLKIGRVLRGLRARQNFAAARKSPTPPSRPLGIDPERLRLLDAQFSVSRTQYDLRSFDNPLGFSPRAGQSLNDRPLFPRQLDLRGLLGQSDLHAPEIVST